MTSLHHVADKWRLYLQHLCSQLQPSSTARYTQRAADVSAMPESARALDQWVQRCWRLMQGMRRVVRLHVWLHDTRYWLRVRL